MAPFKTWYTHLPSCVRLINCLSDPHQIACGKDLPHTLFDCDGQSTKAYDDLRTTAATQKKIFHQASVIQQFTDYTCLKLNISKLEVVKISKAPEHPENLEIAVHTMCTIPAAKWLGVWWQSNCSASKSVNENIKKARKAFFALGSLRCFPRESKLTVHITYSIFESCVLQVLLYGCET